jgi:protein-S-isoprenylcysteine O-methyltransferase Ste14
MSRFIAFLYGVASYCAGFGALLYSIAFVADRFVPRTIDHGGAIEPMAKAIVVNVALMGIFAIQHSVMARKGFKAVLTRLLPPAVERSTYVLFSALALALLFWQWRPMPELVWSVGNPAIAAGLMALSLLGWGILFLSTFLINHFELFGLQQVASNLFGFKVAEPRFRTPLLYRLVRHPIYLGLLIAFWSAPVMTRGHLLFAAVTTAYIFVGIALEERDLIGAFGDQYRSYRKRVPMVLPWPR